MRLNNPSLGRRTALCSTALALVFGALSAAAQAQDHLTISTNADANVSSASPFQSVDGTAANLSTTSLLTALGSGPVTVRTVGGGDIRLANSINWNATNDLLLESSNDILAAAQLGSVNAKTITLSAAGGITLANPGAAANGGAIYLTLGNTLVLTGQEITITNNRSNGMGGAIYSQAATDATVGSITIGEAGSIITITGNNAVQNGGGIMSNGPITLTGSAITVSDNHAGALAWGGGLYTARGGITVNGALTASGNTADQNGGAFVSDGNFIQDGGSVVMDANVAQRNFGGAILSVAGVSLAGTSGDVVLTNNSASVGGAIYANSDVAIGNAAAQVRIAANQSAQYSGAVLTGGTLTVAGTEIAVTGNRAGSSDGGALTAARGVTVGNEGSVVEISGNSAGFDGSGNVAGSASGGAIFASGGSGITLAGQSIAVAGNIATESGGGIYSGDGAVTIGTAASNVAITGNSAPEMGGAIYADRGDVTVNGQAITLSGNQAGTGGAIYTNLSGVTLSGPSVTLSDNIAGQSGGAIYSAAPVTIGGAGGDVVITGNQAQSRGGAIYANAGGVVLSGQNITVSGNAAGNGAIYAENGNVIFRSAGGTIHVDNNMPFDDQSGGGAIMASGVVTIDNAGGTTSLNGNGGTRGAIYAQNSTGALTAIQINGAFTANGNGSAGSTRGALYADQGDIIVDGGDIVMDGNSGRAIQTNGNVSLAATAGNVDLENHSQGGAVLAGGTVTIGHAGATTRLVGSNSGTGNGAIAARNSNGAQTAIRITGAFTAIDNIMDSTGLGGALSASRGDIIVDGGDIIMTGNFAAGSGDAIYTADGNISLATTAGNVVISDNGGYYGGDPVISSNGTVTIGHAGATIALNGNDGGIVVWNPNGEQTAIRITGALTANDNVGANGNGSGALYARQGDIVVDGGDIAMAGNAGSAISARDGGVFLANTTGSADLENNRSGAGGAIGASGDVIVGNPAGTLTLSGNRASGEGGAIRAGGAVRLTGTDISNNVAAGDGGTVKAAGDFTLTSTTTDTITNNLAGGNGGAFWVGNVLTLDSSGGDMIFSGNRHRVTFTDGVPVAGTGTANAIWLDNSNGTGRADILPNNHTITFFDPIAGNTGNLIDVSMFGNGTVVFDGANHSDPADRRSDIYANTSVYTNLIVRNNAVYGVQAGDVGGAVPAIVGVGGAATLATGGTIRADQVIIGDPAGNMGIVNIGAAAGDTPVAPGVLDTPDVWMWWNELVFNHTDPGYVFAPRLSTDAGSPDVFGIISQLAGTTILTADSDEFYSTTRIDGGILRVDGTLGSASATATVGPGGTLAGSGTLGGAVAVQDGGILAPNAGAPSGVASALTIGGSLTLGAASVLNYNFGEANANNADTATGPTGGGGPLNDLVTVQGDLTLDGTLNVAVPPGGAFLPGVYRVFNYEGALTDNGLALGTMPAGSVTEQIQTDIDHQVNLIVVAAARQFLTFWDGGDEALHGDGLVSGGPGLWQHSSGNSNWTDQSGTPIAGWRDDGFAIFQGAPGIVRVDNSLGTVTASGLQFDADGYVVAPNAVGDVLTLVDLPGVPSQSVIRVGAGAVGRGTVATINIGLTGTTQLVKTDPGTLVLNGVNSYAGGTSIDDGTLQIARGSTTSRTNLGEGPVFIGARATLLAASGGDFTFANPLAGTGRLAADNGGGAFSFAPIALVRDVMPFGPTAAAGTTFSGTLALSNNSFQLDGINAAAMANATLSLGTGNVTTVGPAPQSLRGLVFDGGTLVMQASAPAASAATNLVTVNSLDVSGTGAVRISLPDSYALTMPAPTGERSLFAQSHPEGGLQLVAATGSVFGDASGLAVQDQDGQTIGAPRAVDIRQDGTLIAIGTYDDRFNTGGGTGLYLGYQLTDLDLQPDQTLTLAEAAGAAFNDYDLAARLTGSGNLVIAANQIVSLSNGGNDFTGTTRIASGTLQANAANVIASSSAVTVAEGAAFDTNGFDQAVTNLTGSGRVTGGAASTLTLNNSGSPTTFDGAISGEALAVDVATGTVILTGANSHGGATNVAATLQAGAANTFSPNSAVTVAAGGTLDLAGFSQSVPALANAGLVSMGTAPGTVLTINGNYVGNGGVIAMNTVFGGDDSPTDRLVINGGTASGSTVLRFTNVGGTGAQTVRGIEVVEAANGGTTAADAFSLGGQRYTAGAYEYTLQRVGESWFLTNALIDGGGTTPQPPSPILPTFRPEAPVYGLAGTMARSLGLTTLGTLHERVGEQENIRDAATGRSTLNGVWGRVLGGYQQYAFTGAVNPSVKGNDWGLQAGLDLYRATSGGGARDHAGLYGAYGRFTSTTLRGDILGATDTAAGRLKLSGPSLGAYWTHYGATGWYVDAVVQGSWYAIDARSVRNSRIDTDARGIAASLEAGYPIRFAGNGAWAVEPQAQIIYQRLSVDSARDDLSQMDWTAASAWTGRLGLRVQHSGSGRDGTSWQPWARINLWRSFAGTDGLAFDGNAPIDTRFGGTALDGALGLTVKLGARTSLYGQASYRHSIGGRQDQSAMSGSAGIRINW